MELSSVGVLADVFWHEIPHHAQNVELGAFVVMLNHVHGILILNSDTVAVETVETGHALFLLFLHDAELTPEQQLFRNQGKNTISSIAGSYKSAVTKHANRLGFESGWQVRFHDHIIRNNTEYQHIHDYIETNPLNWENDKFFEA